MIKLIGVRKIFPGRNGKEDVEALHDINLAINENEFLTIIGPSGCGKTTLLRAIAGLVPIDAGEVLIDGTPVRGPGPERAMVFQNIALLPWDTVLANVAFGLELRGVPKDERETTADDPGEIGADENDPLFNDAVRLVIEFGKASTSLLQRRLRVGYGRAAHLIDLMERDGIVGAADGPKPREVLKRPDWISEVEESMR